MKESERVSEMMPVNRKENRSNRIRKADSFQPSGSLADRVLFLQRTIGNQAVRSLIRSRTIQTKLWIGQPGDKYEQEADRVADTVMRMPEIISREELHIQRSCPACDENELKRQPIKEEEEEEKLQAKTTSDRIPEIDPNIESHIQSLNGGGQPLSEESRAFFEPRFGYDFSQVRVHTDVKAEEAARAVNARALTLGRDVVFGTGQYSPDTMIGKRLLAHELVHVVQQGKANIQLQRDLFGMSLIDNLSQIVQKSLADAYDSYRGECECGERLENNCAHYLSDALIRGGFDELDGGRGALYRKHNGRVVCKAGRPVRARELRDWFATQATERFKGEPDDDQYWAVYQHDGYPGGHVVIHKHNGREYTWAGTGDYPDWGEQSHYTW